MKISPTNQRIQLLSTSMKLYSFKDYEQTLREAISLTRNFS